MPKQWTPDEILDLARTFQPACILAAAADLNLFTVLANESLSAPRITDKLDADLRGTTILLDALVALELLEKRDDRYNLPPGVDRLLTETGANSVLPMLQHQANCLRRWSQLARAVQAGTPPDPQPSVRGQDADQTAFIQAMHTVSGPVADQIVADLEPLTFTHLLDVGGATGTWTIALLQRHENATATIFDLPHVIPLAEQRIAQTNLADRVNFAAGDFMADPLPKSADLAWVSAIVHQNSRQQNRQLFSAVFDALTPGGQILIRDVLMEDSHTAPAFGALFAVNMLSATEGGSTFTFQELSQDLETAGFKNPRILRTDDAMNAVINAQKPDNP